MGRCSIQRKSSRRSVHTQLHGTWRGLPLCKAQDDLFSTVLKNVDFKTCRGHCRKQLHSRWDREGLPSPGSYNVGSDFQTCTKDSLQFSSNGIRKPIWVKGPRDGLLNNQGCTNRDVFLRHHITSTTLLVAHAYRFVGHWESAT